MKEGAAWKSAVVKRRTTMRIERMNVRRHYVEFTIALGVLLISGVHVSGCTKATRLSEAEWDDIEEVETGDYRIRTRDGQEYATGRFTKTDSTVVMHEIYRNSRRIEVDPIVIPVGEIESVKKVSVWKFGTAVSAVIAGSAVAFMVFMWLVFRDMGGWT